MTGWRTNHWPGPSVLGSKLLAHTCTVARARRPPVMWKLARWVVVAVVASIIVLQALAGPPLVRTRLT